MSPISSKPDPSGHDKHTANDSNANEPPLPLDSTGLIAFAFLLGSATALGASSVYRRFFKRINNAEWVTPDLLKHRRWITGVVTSVGDADNFRLYHTPGFGWRLPFKLRHVPTTHRELKGKTIHIRMAGMDAPEGAHFGRPAQPHAADALSWLKENIEGRRIKCQLFSRDQYKRVVAIPLLPPRRWRWWTRIGAARNLPLEMVRAGWGLVYEEAGAEYGSWGKEAYLAAEAEARAARRGVWQSGKDIESPAEYKRRFRTAKARIEEVEEVVDREPASERVGLLARILRRGKRGRSFGLPRVGYVIRFSSVC
ncbi:mitochondrion protein [Russula earlei]|uniref:Mitochondrion protein n=1 Tax=Russula earlei TaxID=71964 RepID=A0ACC0U129_9AGAM|nr:mitochondrion protein [Russula earlei]